MLVTGKPRRRAGLATSARKLNEVSREAIKLTAYFWHKYLRPKHFTHAGATEYGYAKRSWRYELVKLKKFGHTYPLVLSGDSLRDTEQQYTITATATQTKGAIGRVAMRARNLNWRTAKMRMNMRDELLRTSGRDISAMKEVLRINHAAGMKQLAANSPAPI